MQNTKYILLIDSSGIIATHLKIMLKDISGVDSIEVAHSAVDAKKIFDRKNPDVVILDLKLREGSGMDMLKWIKEKNSNVPVVIFSNHSDEWHRELSKKAGADCFLDKSSEFEQLPEIISNILK